ncbi:MAG TPA: HAD family hydrolase [Tepidisphaeraceae bacterium]|jgi:phosphoglycolate phosphatase
MPYRAILFDLDGTLLDTLDDIADAGNAALTSHGFPAHPVPAYRHFVGEGVATLIQRILAENHRDEATLAAVAKSYVAAYQKNWNIKSRPYPGIPEMLDELARRQIRLAILSNKPHDFTCQCVETFLAKWKFEEVLGATAKLPRKPNPAAALHVAQMMQLPPADFLYLGDTNTDMQTAVAAGMYPVGVLWGFRDRPELEAAGAKTIIAHPSELITLMMKFT